MAFRKRTVALLDDLRIIPLRRARGAHPATFPGAGRAVGNVRRMVVQAGQRWTRTKSRLRRQRTASRHECVRTQLQRPGWVRPALPSSFFTMSNSPLRGSRRACLRLGFSFSFRVHPDRGVGGAPTGAYCLLSRLPDATFRAGEARRVQPRPQIWGGPSRAVETFVSWRARTNDWRIVASLRTDLARLSIEPSQN